MTKRTDLYATFAVNEFENELTAEQVELLETEGRCKLSKNLKNKISQALYHFTVSKRQEKMASKLSEQKEILGDFEKAIKKVHAFFQISEAIEETKDWHAKTRARHRIEDALEFQLNDNGEILWGLNYEFLEAKRENYKAGRDPRILEDGEKKRVVDLKHFATDINWIRLALMKAQAILDAEKSEDKGGQEQDDVFDGFLIVMYDIYNQTQGQKKKLIPFLYATLTLIPEDIRPIYPDKPTHYAADEKKTDPLRERLKKAKNRKNRTKH